MTTRSSAANDIFASTPAGDGSPMSPSSVLPQRKKLQLKPRSVIGQDDVLVLSPRSGRLRLKQRSSKTDPFGAALPREDVLKLRGIDPTLMDSRIDQKAQVFHFTKDQEDEIETVRAELTFFEKKWQEANEKELPEEEFRTKAEAKRKELNGLMEKYKYNGKVSSSSLTDPNKIDKYLRPSERRRRLSDTSPRTSGNNDQNDPVYSSFSTNTRRSRRHSEQAHI